MNEKCSVRGAHINAELFLLKSARLEMPLNACHSTLFYSSALHLWSLFYPRLRVAWSDSSTTISQNISFHQYFCEIVIFLNLMFDKLHLVLTACSYEGVMFSWVDSTRIWQVLELKYPCSEAGTEPRGTGVGLTGCPAHYCANADIYLLELFRLHYLGACECFSGFIAFELKQSILKRYDGQCQRFD